QRPTRAAGAPHEAAPPDQGRHPQAPALTGAPRQGPPSPHGRPMRQPHLNRGALLKLQPTQGRPVKTHPPHRGALLRALGSVAGRQAARSSRSVTTGSAPTRIGGPQNPTASGPTRRVTVTRA